MIFIELGEALDLHQRLIARYGGSHGPCDEGALQSALIAPLNRFWYEGVDDLARLAATYSYHLAKAHAFLDGNKRVAAAVSLSFIYANGGEFAATENEIVEFYMRIAAGKSTRADAEEFFKRHVTSPAK